MDMAAIDLSNISKIGYKDEVVYGVGHEMGTVINMLIIVRIH